MEMERVVKVGFLAAVLVFALGCGKADKVVKGTEQNIRFPSLMHSWTGECVNEPLFGAAAGRRSYKFAGADYLEVIELYSDGQCKDAVIRVTYEGTFDIKADSAEVVEAKRLHILKSHAYVNVLSDVGVKLMGAVNACGVQQYVAGTRYEVTAHAGEVTCPLEKLPKDIETIAKVDNETLYFGEWLEGAAIGKNIAALNQAKAWHRAERDLTP